MTEPTRIFVDRGSMASEEVLTDSLAFLTDPAVVKRILDHLKLPSASPPLAPARGPVELDDMFFEDARFTDLATDPWPEKAKGHARSPP